jgi:hypothetical protein
MVNCVMAPESMVVLEEAGAPRVEAERALEEHACETHASLLHRQM